MVDFQDDGKMTSGERFVHDFVRMVARIAIAVKISIISN